MKHSNIFSARPGWLLLLLCLFATNHIHAQWVPASTTADYQLVTSVPRAYGLPMRCAAIDYSNVSTCSGCANPQQVYALTYGSSSNGSTWTANLIIADDGFSPAITISPSSWTYDGGPIGVVIGNDANTSNTDLLVGVVYANGGNIHLVVYSVSNIGTGSALSISTYSSNTIISGSYYGTCMDIVPEYNNPFVSTSSSTSLPYCSKAMIAYSDATRLHVLQEDLNTYVSSPTINTISTGTSGGMMMDISGVQVYNGASVENHALFPFFNITGPNALSLYDWDYNTNTVSGPTFIANAPGCKRTAIDAIKDVNIYGTGLADWMVAYMANSGSYEQVFEYNNISGGQNVTAAGGFNLSGYDNIYPDIAIAPGSISISQPNYYTIGYVTAYASLGSDIAAQEVDMTGTVSNSINYEIPMTINTNDDDVVMATSCNTNGCSTGNQPYLYTFWSNYNGTTDDIYVKSSGDPLAFKATAVPKTLNNKDWLLGPNPATNYFTLSAPMSYDLNSANNYKITDILGRLMATSGINSSSQQINISGLQDGLYLLHIYEAGNEVKTMKFVKE